MSKDKYPSIFSRQMKAIVYIEKKNSQELYILLIRAILLVIITSLHRMYASNSRAILRFLSQASISISRTVVVAVVFLVSFSLHV